MSLCNENDLNNKLATCAVDWLKSDRLLSVGRLLIVNNATLALTEKADASDIIDALRKKGIFSDDGFSFRLSPEPFKISSEELKMLNRLGRELLGFYKAANRLYFLSSKGQAPGWVSDYLEMGKPEFLIKLSRLNRTKSQIPAIIRPDVIPHENGYTICELDSVPGGFGNLAALNSIYPDCIGGSNDIPEKFYKIFKSLSKVENPNVGIIISKESGDYRPEMEFLANYAKEKLKITGLHVVLPSEIILNGDGLYISVGENDEVIKLDAVYRFYELFDLENIPKAELLAYSMKKNITKVTPPYKPFLEEKLLLALFHHPALSIFWKKELGQDSFDFLAGFFPESWIVDSTPVPPHAFIPGLTIGGAPVASWDQLKKATKKERTMILKVSGFSPDSWGSRGVYAGHDMSEQDWGEVIDEAVAGFSEKPYVLQKFYKGKKVNVNAFDSLGNVKSEMGRVRLSPYYFTDGDDISLVSVLATVCPLDKVLIHGMSQAIMMPCSVE